MFELYEVINDEKVFVGEFTMKAAKEIAKGDTDRYILALNWNGFRHIANVL